MDCSKRSAAAVASLPDDTLVEILSRVPFKSLCRCKCVSKAWRDLITDPLNRKKLPQTLEGFFFIVNSCVDDSDSDSGDDGEDIGSDGGSDNFDSDGDGEDSGSGRGGKNSDSDNGDGEDSGSDGGGDDSQSANGDGEDKSGDDGGGDDNDSDDGDGEDSSSDGSDNDNLRHQVCVHFIDMLGRPPRPVDHCFPFLTELPGIVNIFVLDDCNGLLLFGCFQGSGESLSKSYIVSNPATEQWVVVPDPDMKWLSFAYLVFDRAASSHFHLVQIRWDMIPVHIYSSKSGVWSPVRSDWGDLRMALGLGIAYANGMLYAVLYKGDQIAVMDVEGNTRKIIPVPFQEGDEFRPCSDYVGQSQGRLHLIYHADLGHHEISPEQQNNKLFIWVLEDYDTEEWVLKDTVSFLKLFGQTINGFEVVAIHPDQNLVYLQHFNRELISYNMDSKEVCHLCTLGTGYRSITPYVPYCKELSTLENKH
ncbi:uncharacterized protein [Miscanthus floridulus]|uniref:uncharacterized protein n=1 Tax=Miscanthus floridulus TaxID=154761 RepID=UPI0034595986